MRCPICNGVSFREWCKVQPYSILKCAGCGMGITAPFPTKEELRALNKEIYDVEERIQTYLSRQTYFERRYKGYIENIKKIKNICGKLLDIGCNIGLFVKVAQEAGFEAEGVELNEGCAAYARRKWHLNIENRYLEDIAFPDETFDVITLFDVLEHIPEMGGFIDELRRVLKDDGLVVIQSPNLDSLMAALTKDKWPWLTPPDHLYHFTVEAMEKFLRAHRFSIKQIRTWEPAEDFSNNLISAYRISGLFGKLLQKFLEMTMIVLIPTILLQKLWWRKNKGGLIEVYAAKNRD